MLRAIEFKDKRFMVENNNNLFSPITQNTIVFKGSHKVWQDGKDEMYKMICNGRYGTYDGKWIDLHGKHWDEETHNCVAECNMHIKD